MEFQKVLNLLIRRNVQFQGKKPNPRTPLHPSNPSNAKIKHEDKPNTQDAHSNPILLLDIAPLVQGKLVKRPSSSIRSPYVADVQILPDGPIVLAHAPSLSVGGMCAPGSIVYMSIRPEGGKTSHAIELVQSIPDSTQSLDGNTPVLVGAHPRLAEILVERILRLGLLEDKIGFGPATDCKTECSSPKKQNSKRAKSTQKTFREKNATVQTDDVVEDEPEKKNETVNKKSSTYIRQQRQYGDSRIDFELTSTNIIPPTSYEESEEQLLSQQTETTKIGLIEVKNVVCADYHATDAPEKKGKDHCVIISSQQSKEKYRRSGLFPWGVVNQTFEGQKVVSARAIKHVRNMADMSKSVEGKETKKSVIVHPIIFFLVNRSDCFSLRACDEICPVFAKELKRASDSGVTIVAVRVKWSETGQAYFDGTVDVNV